jgi:hypothetical protein
MQNSRNRRKEKKNQILLAKEKEHRKIELHTFTLV